MSGFYVALCILFACLLATGQILFKMGALLLEQSSRGGLSLDVLKNGYLVLAVCLYALATVLWIWILRRIPLNVAYPFTAIAYMLVPIAGFFILKEPLSGRLVFGSLLIVAGVWIIGGADW